jgi:hypothetical protein
MNRSAHAVANLLYFSISKTVKVSQEHPAEKKILWESFSSTKKVVRRLIIGQNVVGGKAIAFI